MIDTSEKKRFEMHLALKNFLGNDVADTLMQHLPPAGWSDVARLRDIAEVRTDVTRVREDITRVREDVRRLERRMTAVVGVGVTLGLALLALQVQIMLAIAGL